MANMSTGGARNRSHTQSKSRSRKGGQQILNADNTAISHSSQNVLVNNTGNKPPYSPYGYRGGKTKRSKSIYRKRTKSRSRYGGWSFLANIP